MKVGLLGAGTMGAPIAANIARAGHDVVVWNRTRSRAESIEGVRVADSPAEAAEGVDVLVTMLSDGPAVDDCIRDALGHLAGVWAQMSTVGVAWTDRLATAAAERDIDYVDAPVVGSRLPAEAGELIVLAGGADDSIETASPVFDAVGRKTVRAGGVGAGTRLKLVVNSYIFMLMETLAETVALARTLDLDPRLFLEAIDGAPMSSTYAQMKGGMMADRSYEPAFALELALKDARLAREAAAEAALPALDTAIEHMERAVADGHGREDMAALARALDG